MDDHSIGTVPRAMQIKLGAYLTNLMCKNLKFRCGQNKFMLLKPQLVKTGKSAGPGKAKKYVGHIAFNKAFVQDFIQELDKSHDLNLQIDRSLPMIYPPAPWKNFFFGGYYLRQTKMAKVEPHFETAMRYLVQTDLQPMCQTLDILGKVPWTLNNRVLDTIEYVWSIGGGLGKIPNRYNARTITPEMIKEAHFTEKLKLLKEHQQNSEAHSLRCSFLLNIVNCFY